MTSAKRGFSLIETLVAITIASIAVLALMQVVSRTSNASANLLQRFDSSLMMGLIAGDINESSKIGIMTAEELLATRYDIDHPVIRSSLKQTAYEVDFLSKERVSPLVNSITIQKVSIQNSEDHKSFYLLTSGRQ